MSYKFCWLLASKQSAEPVWHIPDAVCTVLDSWWCTERPSETCRVLFQNKINLRHCASCWVCYGIILWCTVLETSKRNYAFSQDIIIAYILSGPQVRVTSSLHPQNLMHSSCFWYWMQEIWNLVFSCLPLSWYNYQILWIFEIGNFHTCYMLHPPICVLDVFLLMI